MYVPDGTPLINWIAASKWRIAGLIALNILLIGFLILTSK